MEDCHKKGFSIFVVAHPRRGPYPYRKRIAETPATIRATQAGVQVLIPTKPPLRRETTERLARHHRLQLGEAVCAGRQAVSMTMGLGTTARPSGCKHIPK